MKRIGILSDTHAYWDDRYLQYFEQCDEIWHAGDIGSTEVADRLADFRPLRAVVGNCDGGDLRRMFPKLLRWSCEGADVLMTHIGGWPGHYPQNIKRMLEVAKPDIFVCGHSHILKVMYDKEYNFLHINPGAAGRQGFHLKSTLVRLTVDEGKPKDLEIMELEKCG